MPKKPLPTASGPLSLSRECLAKAHSWKHKPAAQRLWGWASPHPWAVLAFAQMAAFLCAGLSTRQILPAESWHQGTFGFGSLSVEEHSPWIAIPVSQGILKTLEGPTLKSLCQHSNLLCCKSNWKCVQSAFPPKNQRKKRKAQGPELSLPFSAPTKGRFLWGNTSFSH